MFDLQTSSVASNLRRSLRLLSIQTSKMDWGRSFISLSNLCYSVVSCPVVNLIPLTLLAGSLTFFYLFYVKKLQGKKINKCLFFFNKAYISFCKQLNRFVGDVSSRSRTYFKSYQMGCEIQFPFHFQYQLSFCRSC